MALTNIILTGGINHDYEDTSNALAEVLLEADIKSTVYLDIDEGFEALAQTSFDLVTLSALRWRMLDDDKYIPFRAEWQYEISEQNRNNLIQHVIQGRGLLGLHTAAICFDTWQQWPQLLGAKWVWGQTFHPPPEHFTVKPVSDHEALSGLEDFPVIDEIYHNIEPQPGAAPLLSATSSEDGSTQTLAWAQHFESGRVIYHALGHDRASVTSPGHKQFLRQAALWCIGDQA